MLERLIPFLFTMPFLLMLAAWIRLYRSREKQWPRQTALDALGIVTASAALAAGTFLYYSFRPSPGLLPWQDSLQTPQAPSLSILAFVGMIVGFIAAVRGAPGWLVWIVEVASIPLLIVGILASAPV
jgi:hypothetical protein